MPRGAAVVYPKDAGQVVAMGDIYPGARVVEAGVGSGALTMSLLRAVGDHRPAAVHRAARPTSPTSPGATSRSSSAARTRPGGSRSATSSRSLPDATVEAGSVDRVVLDMLAPWECLDVVADALAPGGVLVCYVATATQLSRVAEAVRDDGALHRAAAWESLVRGWHLEGLAVRPQHRMVGHTGFLVTARRLAPGRDAAGARRRARQGHVTARGRAEERLDGRGLGEAVRRVRRTRRRRVRRRRDRDLGFGSSRGRRGQERPSEHDSG